MNSEEIALVVHPLFLWGGGEYYLRVLSALLPAAPIYTAWYDPSFTKKHFPDRRIVASHLQKLPLKKRFYRELIPLLPQAYKKFDLNNFKLVIVVSDSFEKNLTIGENTKVWLHILTPPRFLWLENRASQTSNKITYRLYKSLLKNKLHQKWKKLDIEATRRADFITSISNTVAQRVKRFYNLDSEVLYPPVELYSHKQNTKPLPREEWFLYFGRIEAYKGVELAIRSCIELKKKLVVAGTGSDVERLKSIVCEMNGTNYIQFIGFVSEEEKWDLYRRCKALIYPVKDEDFGIVPVEANSAGAPVIAYAGGGATETIVDGETGFLFKDYSVDALSEKMTIIKSLNIDQKVCRHQAQRFSRDIFEGKVISIVEETISGSLEAF
jgi:glycosyltransferase involved in cell wall biosynthesis